MAFISLSKNQDTNISHQKTITKSPLPKKNSLKINDLSELIEVSQQLLSRVQEGFAAIEELKGTMEQIAAAAEESAGAAEESLGAVTEIKKN